VLNELQEKGLVEKTISKPADFKAVPIQEGLEILLSRKNKEYEEIEETTKRLQEELKNNNKAPKTAEPGENFCLVSSKEGSLRKRKRCMASAQKSIDVATSFKRFLQITATQSDDIKNAIERGVKFRWLLSKDGYFDDENYLLQQSKDSLFHEIRYNFLWTAMGKDALAVFDKKEVLIVIEEKQFFLDSELLWSSNSSFAAIAQNYFDLAWEKAAYK
jgi:sugar-specific transcriptional regulator TrmB